MATRIPLVPAERIEQAIHVVRGQRVMLDRNLAALYGVETKVLNQAVRRNKSRFPSDFIFQLSSEESDALLRSQIVTSKEGRGGRRYLPYVFTEQGVAMLSTVLKSARAVQVNIEIMRAFVRLRHVLAANAELARRLDEFEKRLGAQDKQFLDRDQQFRELVKYIKQLTELPPAPPKRGIGFHVSADDKSSARSRASRR
jgi:hypothetical protein